MATLLSPSVQELQSKLTWQYPEILGTAKTPMATLLSHSMQQFQSRLMWEYLESLSMISGTIKIHGNFTLQQYTIASVQTDVRTPRDFRNCKNSMATLLSHSIQVSFQIDVRIPTDPKHDFRNCKNPRQLYPCTLYNTVQLQSQPVWEHLSDGASPREWSFYESDSVPHNVMACKCFQEVRFLHVSCSPSSDQN